VVVTVRNYSNEAAALGTQVQLDYSSFGIGFPRQSLGIQTVDLNKAGLNPDERSIEFFLPQSIRDKFGHLSVFVTVHHPHDRNANNNTGEQAWSASPANDGQAASFAFQLRNSLAQATTFDLVVLEATWSAALSDNQVILAAGQVRNLMLNVQVPVGASGQQHFNVVALVNGALFGGVHHRFDV